MPQIVSISVMRTDESCKRTRYYVRLTTDEGYTTEPVCWSTGSVQRDIEGNDVIVPGLELEEARKRAVLDADDWGDLLGITPVPFVDKDGITYPPEHPMRRYTTRRILKQRREAAGEPADVED